MLLFWNAIFLVPAKASESDATQSPQGLVSGENLNLFNKSPETPAACVHVPVKKKIFSISKLVGGAFKKSELTVEDLELLSKCNIAILIDKSSSMNGLATNFPAPISRWNWCAYQMLNFERQIAPVNQNVDLLLFDSKFVAFPNVSLTDVDKIFNQFNADGGTDVQRALEAVFEEHFRKRDLLGDSKDLIVVVITDCGPLPGYTVTKAACNRIARSDEIKITYIDVRNRPLLNPYQMQVAPLPIKVRSMSFGDANSMGLGKALVAILKDNK